MIRFAHKDIPLQITPQQDIATLPRHISGIKSRTGKTHRLKVFSSSSGAQTLNLRVLLVQDPRDTKVVI
jgi:hypothetical protein